jgi:hypothetical protein
VTAYAFGLKTPRDFLEKARRDVRRLEQATSSASSLEDVEDLQDLAINAAWSLWHVADWIARCPEQRYREAVERIRVERPSRKTKPRAILHEHILDDSHMALCEALANGSKHFELHEPPKFDATRIFRYGHDGPYAGTSAVDVISGVTAGGTDSIAMPKYFFAKLRINGKGLPALDVFNAALAYWDRFFEGYGL